MATIEYGDERHLQEHNNNHTNMRKIIATKKKNSIERFADFKWASLQNIIKMLQVSRLKFREKTNTKYTF